MTKRPELDCEGMVRDHEEAIQRIIVLGGKQNKTIQKIVNTLKLYDRRIRVLEGMLVSNIEKPRSDQEAM